MKAIVLQQPRELQIQEIDEPDEVAADEVLVQVRRVGICGTDIAGYLGKFPFYGYPRIPGHELGVEVLQVGQAVKNVRPGDRCAVEPYINDLASFATRRGRPNCCEHLQVLGVHVDGGMRPRFKVPGRKLHPSRHLAWEQLALVETLGIGCHAVDRAAPEPGEHALLIGAGPIGLSVAQFAKLAGVQLTVMDINSQRLDFCRDMMGVSHTIVYQGDGSELDQLREITDGNLPTIVWDATGNPKSMSNAFQFVGHTGRLVLVGIVTEQICFPDPLFHAREMTLLASRNALPADFGRIINLIEQGAIDTRPWITHRIEFEAVPAEFEKITRPDSGAIKAIVQLD